jgi:MYXO-CTERM domain-containing protein
VVAVWLIHGSLAAAEPLAAPRSASAARPRATLMWESLDPAAVTSSVNSHIIYLNRCAGSGCTVVQGTTNSTTDPAHSSLGHGVLSPFSRSEATWNTVVACMQDVFSPFNVEVTETDPGSAPHFEIMIGGMPQQLGLAADLGGVSPFSCAPYIPNSLVFVFDVWGDDPDEICATAAQEIAHSFALDHAIEPSDPMTYFPYKGRRHFQNMQIQCGSDCDANHHSPLGATCSGPEFQDHPCACGGGAQTQNDIQVITALFGDGSSTPPVVKIVEPKVGDTVLPGFAVSTQISDDTVVASAELRVDGALQQRDTAAPFGFTGPAELADGTHTLEVTGYDNFGTPGRARIQVIVGPGCKAASDCPEEGDACIAGRCVAGPGVQGGLGQVCVVATDCKSWQCANDDGAKFCVEACKPGQCPSSFGCRDDGQGGGVCWPGYDEGLAGCAVGSGSGPAGGPVAMLGLSAGLGALVLRRRRR